MKSNTNSKRRNEKRIFTMTTSAVSGYPPPEVYLGAAGELVAFSADHSGSFYESRAGGRAWAPSKASTLTSHAVDVDVNASPPRGVTLPPRCGCCGGATALVMQVSRHDLKSAIEK